MSDYLQAAVTIWALVNPVVCVAMFTQIEGDRLKQSGMRDATKASLTIFVILALAAIFGAYVLRAFGISMEAFQVTGGIVLAWMGFSMLRGADAHTKAHKPSGDKDLLAPLIMFAASPGTITGVITIATTHSGDGIPVTALVGISIAIVMTWVLMLIAVRTSGHGSRSSLGRDISTRFMGLIVVAMGVQFALAGYQSFMSPS